MSRKRVVELGAFGDSVHELLPEGDGGSEHVGLGEDLLSHALQLRAGEVPLGGDVVLIKIFLDGAEDAHLEAVVLHLGDIGLGHGQFLRGDEVYLDLVPKLETVGLAVYGTAVVEVADKGDVDAVGLPVVVLEEGVLVQDFLGRMLVLAVSGVDECRDKR